MPIRSRKQEETIGWLVRMTKLEDVLSSIERERALNKPTSMTKVDLSNCGLTELPQELYHVADSLEMLNLGGNSISALSDDFIKFKQLKVLFFAGNTFESVPPVLGRMASLNMLSFKSNKLKSIPEEALSPSISWLILTDNQLPMIPSSIGKLTSLRKCMLAGNCLAELPEEMQNCKEIELLRISDNKLTKLPKWLLTLPRLSWLAFSGNALSSSSSSSSSGSTDDSVFQSTLTTATSNTLPKIDWKDLSVDNIVGEGASGVVYKAVWSGRSSTMASSSTGGDIDVALKFFKGAMTSDGSPENEMEVISKIGNHPNFIPCFGRLDKCPADQIGGADKEGLVFPLVSSDFYNILGGPPSFDTCTRDTFPSAADGGIKALFTLPYVLHVVVGIAAACLHLHSTCGLLHGDIYAHNILVQHKALPATLSDTKPALLTDFGAASTAPRELFTGDEMRLLERVEVRAFSCLIEDLLDNGDFIDTNDNDTKTNAACVSRLRQLQGKCRVEQVEARPGFIDIISILQAELSSLV